MTIRDEILSAYLDGELAPEDAEPVRALLSRDGKLRERLERLRLASDLTREALAPLAVATPALRAATGISWRRYAAPGAAAIAACAAGIVFGLLMSGDGEESLFMLDGGIIAAPPVAHALDETPSGGSMRSGDVELAALYSFRDEEGRACRVFRARLSGAAVEGAACRDGARWRMLALTPAEASALGYTEANSAEPAAIAAAVDEAYAQEIDAAEEAALIAGGWMSSK
jgi:hypothetical protein